MFIFIFIFISISIFILICILIIISIFIFGHPPPLDRPRNCISDLSRKGGGGGGKSTTPKFLEFPKIQNSKKTQPKFRIFGNSRNLLKIQKHPKFLEFPKSKNPKIPTQVSDFWKLEEFAQNPKKPKIPRVSKIPKPQFRIFGNSKNLLKIQKHPKFLEFPKSKNPKIPTPVSDFWKLEEFAQNPTKPKIPRVSKIPKIQKPQPQFRIVGNSRNLLKIQKNPKFLEFPKFQKSKNLNPSFGFLETREFWVFLDFEQIPRVSNNPKLGLGFLDFWNFGNSRNFGFCWISRLPLEFLKIQTLGWNFWILGILETRGILGFLDFEQIPRVSKNPKLGLGFLDFWNFGNSRNFGFFWILSKFLEFPKIRNLGWGFWIFAMRNMKLETRAGASKSKNRANSSSFQNSKPWGGFFWIFGILETRGICSIFGF